MAVGRIESIDGGQLLETVQEVATLNHAILSETLTWAEQAYQERLEIFQKAPPALRSLIAGGYSMRVHKAMKQIPKISLMWQDFITQLRGLRDVEAMTLQVIRSLTPNDLSEINCALLGESKLAKGARFLKVVELSATIDRETNGLIAELKSLLNDNIRQFEGAPRQV